MSELTKRICLSEFWIGDIVYHKATGKRGVVVGVQFRTAQAIPAYAVAFVHNDNERLCEPAELSVEKVFLDAEPEEAET